MRSCYVFIYLGFTVQKQWKKLSELNTFKLEKQPYLPISSLLCGLHGHTPRLLGIRLLEITRLNL